MLHLVKTSFLDGVECAMHQQRRITALVGHAISIPGGTSLMAVSQRKLVIGSLIAALGFAVNAFAQGPEASSPRTMRPVIRGRQAAVSSMKAEATEVASRILQRGGNAFDAIVGGQAALAVTDFALNGVGSDAVVLVYDAREKKVLSINAEPRAPKLATIEWYEKNSDSKIPNSDGLLSGGIPGVVDAWYILLED